MRTNRNSRDGEPGALQVNASCHRSPCGQAVGVDYLDSSPQPPRVPRPYEPRSRRMGVLGQRTHAHFSSTMSRSVVSPRCHGRPKPCRRGLGEARRQPAFCLVRPRFRVGAGTGVWSSGCVVSGCVVSGESNPGPAITSGHLTGPSTPRRPPLTCTYVDRCCQHPSRDVVVPTLIESSLASTAVRCRRWRSDVARRGPTIAASRSLADPAASSAPRTWQCAAPWRCMGR